MVRAVGFGEKAYQADRYVNRRAEMWDNIRQWLSDTVPVLLPNMQEISDDLCDVNKMYDKQGRLQLEEKAGLKRRLGRSPDFGDALALTFAEPVYEEADEPIFCNGKGNIEQMFLADKRQNLAGW